MSFRIRMFLLRRAAKRAEPIPLLAEDRMTARCLPYDMDVNKHMTNRRYYQFLGLGRMSLMLRNGAWERMLAAGLFPAQGAAAIRFRRPILSMQRFTVTSRIGAWDDRWVYFDHRVLLGEDVAAFAVVKVAFLGKDKRPPSDETMTIMGHEGPRPPLAEHHIAQDALDRALSKMT